MKSIIASLWLVLGVAGTAVAATPSPSPSPTPGMTPTIGSIWISEFLPNPTGSDTGNEWVELHNRSDQPVDLSGLMVVRQSGSTLVTVPAGSVVSAGGYLTVTATGSVINGGDTIILKNTTTEFDRVTYDGNGEEGETWARITESEGGWTSTPTPGAANQFPATIPEPVAGPVPDSGSATATTKATATTTKKPAKTTAKKAVAKKASASKLPASGIPGAAYLLPVILGAVYWYGRIIWKQRSRRAR